MERVTIDYAREHLDELIARAAKGENVEIADPLLGNVQLRATPAEGAERPALRPGRWKGRLSPPPDDFFDPLSQEELSLWYGEQR